VSPQEIIGNKEHVVAIRLLDSKTKEEKTLDIEGVFLAVGHKPNTQLFKNSALLDNNGYVLVKGRSQETSLPGVYAAGDCEDHHYRQAGVAAGSGIKAALDADAFLNELGFNAEIAARLQETQVASVTIMPSLVKHVMSVEEFETELAGSKLPVLVDFYADYCPTCMAMLPHFDAVAQQFKDCAYFLSVDVAAVPGLKEKYHVTKIPCLLLFKDGVQAARYNNAMSKKELQELTAQFVGQTSAVCKEEKTSEQ
jgi:thiol-disulfide isomerase/thioredoxin